MSMTLTFCQHYQPQTVNLAILEVKLATDEIVY